jgi:CHAT domain-containing protein
MQNVYGIAVELDDVLTPLLSKINGKKRIYIVTDRDMEQIPFEIAGKDRPLAERYSICYLPSLSITSSTVKLNGRTASVIGGSSDINSDLDRMALVHAGVFRNDGSTFAHLTIRPDILKGVLVSPVDGKSIPSLAPRRTALYLARGSEADYNSTLAQIAEREGFSMMIVAQPTVRDVNASIFAQYFYQRIAAGDDARDAFYAAMRMIIGHAKYGHPAYWVGMRLYYNGL